MSVDQSILSSKSDYGFEDVDPLSQMSVINLQENDPDEKAAFSAI